MKEEKYIKEKLTDYESPINMEAMWADLEKNLDETEDRKGGFWLWGKGFLMSLAVLALAAILFFTFRNSNTKQQPISETRNTNTEKTITPSTTEQQDTEVLNNNNKSIEQSTILEPVTENKKVTKKKTSQSLEVNSTKTRKSTERVAQKATSTKNGVIKTTPSNNTFRTTKKAIEPINADSGISTTSYSASNSKNTKATALASAAMLAQIHDIAGKEAFLDWTRVLDLRFPSLAFPKAPRIRTTNKKKTLWRAAVNYGLSSTDLIFPSPMGFAGTEVDLGRNHKPAINNTYGISLERVSSKGLKISIGLNYLNHGYIYTDGDEYIANVDQETTTVFISDSGSFIGEEKSSEQVTEGLYTWRYRDYRGWNTFQIPIMVGYEKRKNKLDYSLSAGLAINLLGGPSEILDYSDETRILAESNEIKLSPISERTIFLEDISRSISGIAKAELGYSLKNRIRIFASIEAGRSLQKFAYSEQGLVHINHFGTRTGLSYAF